jgi:hypothetical protein
MPDLICYYHYAKDFEADFDPASGKPGEATKGLTRLKNG